MADFQGPCDCDRLSKESGTPHESWCASLKPPKPVAVQRPTRGVVAGLTGGIDPQSLHGIPAALPDGEMDTIRSEYLGQSREPLSIPTVQSLTPPPPDEKSLEVVYAALHDSPIGRQTWTLASTIGRLTALIDLAEQPRAPAISVLALRQLRDELKVIRRAIDLELLRQIDLSGDPRRQL